LCPCPGPGGEEDGVDHSDADSLRLYTQPEEVAYAYEELMKVSDRFTIAAAFGNVHGEDKPNKKFYDPRVWLRQAEESMNARLRQPFDDLNSVGTLE